MVLPLHLPHESRALHLHPARTGEGGPPGVLGTTANVASSIFSSVVGVLSMMSVDTISLYRGSKVGCPPRKTGSPVAIKAL